MRVEVLSPGRVYTQTRDQGLAIVLRAVRSHLTGEADPAITALAASLEGSGAWMSGLSWSHRNRLSSFVLAGLERNGVDPPKAVADSFLQYRTETFRLNTTHLMTVRKIVPIIEAAGVEVAIIKGPLQQQLNYRDYFAKPAGDVDLLVRSEDFVKARGLIEAQGYYLPKECASPWWRIFLGEQHLLIDQPNLCTIDLHHRVQQPGAPSPSDLGSFLRNRHRISVGAATLPVLSPTDGLLLVCMSLAKALIHREPAGGYAADLLAGLLTLDAEGLAEFQRSAERNQLRRTVRLALRGVDVLYGVSCDIARPGEPRALDHVTDEDLLSMLVTPSDPATQWAKRRNILWALNDAGPVTYIREVGWALGGEVTRRLFQAAPPRDLRAAPAAA